MKDQDNMSLGDPEGLRSENRRLKAELEALQGRVAILEGVTERGELSSEEVQAFAARMRDAANQGEWEAALSDYMRACVVREADPYGCITAFVATALAHALGEGAAARKSKRKPWWKRNKTR